MWKISEVCICLIISNLVERMCALEPERWASKTSQRAGYPTERSLRTSSALGLLFESPKGKDPALLIGARTGPQVEVECGLCGLA